MKLAGIDYSITSPGITVYDTITKKYAYHFLSSRRKLVGIFLGGLLVGEEYPEWETPEQRFDLLSGWALGLVCGCAYARIEGYAFAAKGSSVMQIGENAGLLKHKLSKSGIAFNTIPPTQIKKLATGNGRAKKDEMYDVFFAETDIDLMKVLDVQKKDANPISDIVDSYFICRSLINDQSRL